MSDSTVHCAICDRVLRAEVSRLLRYGRRCGTREGLPYGKAAVREQQGQDRRERDAGVVENSLGCVL